MRKIIAAMLTVAAILVAGCSEKGATGGQQSEAAKRDQAETQKPKTVVVNEGMSKEEEEELIDRRSVEGSRVRGCGILGLVLVALHMNWSESGFRFLLWR